MREFERKAQTSPDVPGGSHEASSNGEVVVQVACDDREAHVTVSGRNTIREVRRQAIRDLQILASDPDKYVVIGPNRQPVSDDRTVDELLAQGQTLSFRLIPQVAFGPAAMGTCNA